MFIYRWWSWLFNNLSWVGQEWKVSRIECTYNCFYLLIISHSNSNSNSNISTWKKGYRHKVLNRTETTKGWSHYTWIYIHTFYLYCNPEWSVLCTSYQRKWSKGKDSQCTAHHKNQGLVYQSHGYIHTYLWLWVLFSWSCVPDISSFQTNRENGLVASNSWSSLYSIYY